MWVTHLVHRLFVATRFAILSTHAPERHAPRLAHPDRSCRGRRQIDMSAAYKGAAIVDAHGHASFVANLHKRAEWQRAMRRRHRSAVQTLTARSATAAEPVRSAVDAGDLGTQSATHGEQKCYGTK
jgi:hypothetical protein